MNRRTACATLMALVLMAAGAPTSAVETQVRISRDGELVLIDAVLLAPVTPARGMGGAHRLRRHGAVRPGPGSEPGDHPTRQSPPCRAARRCALGSLRSSFHDGAGSRTHADGAGGVALDRRHAATGKDVDAAGSRGRRHGGAPSPRVRFQCLDAGPSGRRLPALQGARAVRRGGGGDAASAWLAAGSECLASSATRPQRVPCPRAATSARSARRVRVRSPLRAGDRPGSHPRPRGDTRRCSSGR